MVETKLTKADREALALMPDKGWFNCRFHDSWKVRRVDWRCDRLHALGLLERRVSAGQIGWEYQKAADGVPPVSQASAEGSNSTQENTP